MGPRTWNLVSQLKAYCDVSHGRRARVARELGMQRQVLSHWFSRRKSPTSEQILIIEEFLASLRVNSFGDRFIITLFDDQRTEPCASSSEAVEIAKTWYAELGAAKLPEWTYRIRDYEEFVAALEDYRWRIARLLTGAMVHRGGVPLSVFRTVASSVPKTAVLGSLRLAGS
jgi:hypothetical protein